MNDDDHDEEDEDDKETQGGGLMIHDQWGHGLKFTASRPIEKHWDKCWCGAFLVMRFFDDLFLAGKVPKSKDGLIITMDSRRMTWVNWQKVYQRLSMSLVSFWQIMSFNYINEIQHTSCQGSPYWGLPMRFIFMSGPKQCWILCNHCLMISRWMPPCIAAEM